jgi:hypothetical protein
MTRRYSICTLNGSHPVSEEDIRKLYADYHVSQHGKLDALLAGDERIVTLNDGMCLAWDDDTTCARCSAPLEHATDGTTWCPNPYCPNYR